MSSDKLRELKAIHSALLEERRTWEDDYEQLAKHFLPRKYRNIDQHETNEGGLRRDVLDGAGIRALRVLAAGMHGGMTSPARPWFRLTLADSELAKRRQVRDWLDETEDRMLDLFSRSNFYNFIYRAYQELGCFGTFCGLQHEHPRTGFLFTDFTAGEFCLDANEEGRVDTIFRKMKMTARNMVRQFGYEKCSQAVKRAFDKASTRNSRFEVHHAIMPREDRDPSKLNAENKPWASYYYEPGATTQFLRESGYDMFPGFGVRWDVTGQDVLGRSPAMDSLGDVRMLQSMKYTYLKQEHKRADPPVATPQNLEHPNLLPGGTNPVNVSQGAQAVYPIYQVNPDPRGVKLILDDTKADIMSGMYNDLFRMLDWMAPKQMTATEVAERHQEKLLQLGPVLERLHSELFIPLIDRSFNLMVRNDMLSLWPEEIEGMPIQVEFKSILAQAQQMVNTASVNQFMGFIGSYAQIFPDLTDIPDVDDIGDSYAEYLGLEAKHTTSRDERKARREARAQAQQAAAQAETAASAAQTAKSLGETPVRGGETTALDALLGGSGGGR